MKTDALLRELEALARAVGFEVRYEKGRFRGGRCRLEDRRLVVLNRLHPPEANVAVLAGALRQADLGGVFLPPAVRRVLEERGEKRDGRAETEESLPG